MTTLSLPFNYCYVFTRLFLPFLLLHIPFIRHSLFFFSSNPASHSLLISKSVMSILLPSLTRFFAWEQRINSFISLNSFLSCIWYPFIFIELMNSSRVSFLSSSTDIHLISCLCLYFHSSRSFFFNFSGVFSSNCYMTCSLLLLFPHHHHHKMITLLLFSSVFFHCLFKGIIGSDQRWEEILFLCFSNYLQIMLLSPQPNSFLVRWLHPGRIRRWN